MDDNLVTAEMSRIFVAVFHPAGARETILPRDETISRFSRRHPETPDGYQPATKRRAAPALETGDSQMRTLSFILAFAFVLAGASIAGSSDSSLPGTGTFAYNGAPIASSASHNFVVAAR